MTPEQRAAFRKGDLLGAGMGATELTGGRPVTTQVCTYTSLLSASCAFAVVVAFTASISLIWNACFPRSTGHRAGLAEHSLWLHTK